MLLITSTANIKTWERDNGLYGGLSPLARGTQHRKRLRGGGVRFIPAGAGSSTWRIFATPARTVYPRWRGEHARLVGVFREIAGLSPLARGTLQQSETSWLAVRFIPAGAGNTEQQVFQMASRAVYPRWRGELPRRLAQQSRPRGLSPLARGTLEMTKNARRRNRFIPAGAGNSNLVWRFHCWRAVYPRWRGELIP